MERFTKLMSTLQVLLFYLATTTKSFNCLLVFWVTHHKPIFLSYVPTEPDMSSSRQFLSLTAGNYVVVCKQSSFIYIIGKTFGSSQRQRIDFVEGWAMQLAWQKCEVLHLLHHGY